MGEAAGALWGEIKFGLEDQMAKVFQSNHPLLQHKLALLRDVDTEPKRFRELVREVTWLKDF